MSFSPPHGLTQRKGAAGAQVLSFGHYQPARIVTNDDLTATVDTSDEWIRSRVGVRTRRIANEDETVLDMATAAAEKAVAAAGLPAAEIDLVAVATCSALTPLPNVAASLADRLGLTVAAYDLNTACSGFCYGLATAHHAILAGTARHAVVVGVEKLSDWLDWHDRSTSVIFGDGAGAAVVGPANHEAIGPVVWGSDGSRSELIGLTEQTRKLTQQGQSVFRWAVTAVAPIALEACRQAGVDPQDLAAVVPHQANLRIIESIARKLGADNAVIATDIVESGNTSAASIPLALSKMLERGEVPSGAPVLLIGFGAGLTYASQVILCP